MMNDRQGAIPFQIIKEMMKSGYIREAKEAHVQPASLDLSLSNDVYRMRGSYLPRKGETVAEIVKNGSLYPHPIDRPLERDGIYLIKLNESLQLPPGIHATTSNKSSSGRINLRGRLIVDGVPRFDEVPTGYHGSLWIEVVPKSFPVRVHEGDRINQMRFFHGEARLSVLEHRIAFDRYHLLRTLDGAHISPSEEHLGRGITMTVDLTGNEIIGWKAKDAPTHVLDTAVFTHDPHDFFEPLARPRNGELVLHPEAFFILSTKEKVLVPPNFSAEMAAYDASKGEFRSHFAGFFDPGFGWRAEENTRGNIGVLEVEAHSHDFVLRDAQPICLMVYERMLDLPEKTYGDDLKSNYAGQVGPKLAKWFVA